MSVYPLSLPSFRSCPNIHNTTHRNVLVLKSSIPVKGTLPSQSLFYERQIKLFVHHGRPTRTAGRSVTLMSYLNRTRDEISSNFKSPFGTQITIYHQQFYELTSERLLHKLSVTFLFLCLPLSATPTSSQTFRWGPLPPLRLGRPVPDECGSPTEPSSSTFPFTHNLPHTTLKLLQTNNVT